MSEESDDEVQKQNRAKVNKFFNDAFNYGCHLMNGGEYYNYKYRIAEESLVHGQKMFEFMMQQYRQLRSLIIKEDANKPGVLNQFEIVNEFYELNRNESFQRVGNFDFSKTNTSDKTSLSNGIKIGRAGRKNISIRKLLHARRNERITYKQKLEIVELFKKNPKCKIREIKKKTGIKHLWRDRIKCWANQLEKDLERRQFPNLPEENLWEQTTDGETSISAELNDEEKSSDTEDEGDSNSVAETTEIPCKENLHNGGKKMPILFSPEKIVGRPSSGDEQPPNLSRENLIDLTDIEETQHIVPSENLEESNDDDQPLSLSKRNTKMIVGKKASNGPEEHQQDVEMLSDIEMTDTIEISDDEDFSIDYQKLNSSISCTEKFERLTESPELFEMCESNVKCKTEQLEISYDSVEEYVADDEVEIVMAIFSVPDAS